MSTVRWARMVAVRSGLVVWVLSLLTGCAGSGEDPESTVTDSAGVRIVTHSSAADRPLEWTFTEVARLGRAMAEGPEALYRVDRHTVAFHPEGGFYVLDRGNHRVVRFTADGQLIGSFGQEGEAEGELSNPVTLNLYRLDGRDVVEVTDFVRRKFVRFDLDGDLLEEPDIGRLTGLTRELHRSGDALIREDRRGHRAAFYGGVDSVAELVLRVRGGDTVELARIEKQAPERAFYESCRLKIAQGPFYQRELVWGAAGPLVAVNGGVEYRIDVYDGDSLRRSVRRALEARPLDRGTVERVWGSSVTWNLGERTCDVPLDEVLEARGIAPYLQLLEEVVVSPEGEIWARRRTVSADSAGPVDVFDGSGAYLGTLPPSAPVPALFLPDDRIAVVESGELDVPYVLVYRIER